MHVSKAQSICCSRAGNSTRPSALADPLDARASLDIKVCWQTAGSGNSATCGLLSFDLLPYELAASLEVVKGRDMCDVRMLPCGMK